MKRKFTKLCALVCALSLAMTALTVPAFAGAGGQTPPASGAHTVTVATGIEHGTVAVDKETANQGDAVIVTLTPDTGYKPADANPVTVTGGENPVNVSGSNGTYTFTMPAADVTVSASFAAKADGDLAESTITVTPPAAGGTIVVKVDGAVVTGKVKEAKTVTVEPTPAAGFALVEISYTPDGGDAVLVEKQLDGAYTFTMPAANVTVTATFTKLLEITQLQYYTTVTYGADKKGSFGGLTSIDYTKDATNSEKGFTVYNADAPLDAAALLFATSNSPKDPRGHWGIFSVTPYAGASGGADNEIIGYWLIDYTGEALKDKASIEAFISEHKTELDANGGTAPGLFVEYLENGTIKGSAINYSVDPEPGCWPDFGQVNTESSKINFILVDTVPAEDEITIVKVGLENMEQLPKYTAEAASGSEEKITLAAKGATAKSQGIATAWADVDVTALCAGDEVTVTAKEGYELTAVTATDADSGSVAVTPGTGNDAGKFTFTMPAKNVTVTATADQVYDVTVAADIENGTVTVAPETAKQGDTVTVTATPNGGYKLADTDPVTVTGGSTTVNKTNDTTYTFTMPAADVTVSAAFVQKDAADLVESAITITTPTNGTFTVNDGTADINTSDTVQEGKTVTIEAAADTGYKIGEVSYEPTSGGTKVTLEAQQDGTYTFIMPAEAITVAVTFEAKATNTVTVTVNGTGGTVVAKTGGAEGTEIAAPVEEGTEVTLVVTPDTGHELATLTVKDADGEDVPTADGKFTMPAKAVTVTATFKAVYTITAQTPANGTLNVSKETAAEGEEITVTATPAGGYRLDGITVTGADGTDVPVTNNKFTMPAQAVTVTATFTRVTSGGSGTTGTPPTPSVPDKPDVPDEPAQDGQPGYVPSTPATEENLAKENWTVETKEDSSTPVFKHTEKDGTPTTGVRYMKTADGVAQRYVFDKEGALVTGENSASEEVTVTDSGDVYMEGNRYFLNPDRDPNDPRTCYVVMNYDRTLPDNLGHIWYDQDGISFIGWIKNADGGLRYQTRIPSEKETTGFYPLIVWRAQTLPACPHPDHPDDAAYNLPAGRYFFDDAGVLVQTEGWHDGHDGKEYRTDEKGMIVEERAK